MRNFQYQKKGCGIVGVAAITSFGKCIKRRPLDIDKDQNWLIDQVAQKTNLYFDRSYLHKIMTGRLTTPGIKQAIWRRMTSPQQNKKKLCNTKSPLPKGEGKFLSLAEFDRLRQGNMA